MHTFKASVFRTKIFIVLIFVSYSNSNVFLRDHVNNSGPALFVGIGNVFCGSGIKLEYQYRLFSKLKLFTITPFASIGYWEGIYYKNYVYSLGGDLEIGYKHRLILGYHYGALAESFIEKTETTTIQGITTTGKTLESLIFYTGSGIFVGYKGMLNIGFTWVAAIGAGYANQDQKKRDRKSVV
jgi:hypothetical protein